MSMDQKYDAEISRLVKEVAQLRDQVKGIESAFHELKSTMLRVRGHVRRLRYSTVLGLSEDIAEIIAEIDEVS